MIIFRWFFYDFWRFCVKRENQTKSRKSSKNHQKIIKKSSFCLKNHERPRFWQVFLVFSSKTMIFWWFFDDFLGFCLIFSFGAKPSKSSKNYHFFIIAFIILKKYHFFIILFVLSGDQPPSYENFFVSKSSWQTCWRWLSQGLNSARLPCTWTLNTPAANR